jgi:hypothetical protein
LTSRNLRESSKEKDNKKISEKKNSKVSQNLRHIYSFFKRKNKKVATAEKSLQLKSQK